MNNCEISTSEAEYLEENSLSYEENWRYENPMEALKEIMDELYDNPYSLAKPKLHEDLMFLCRELGVSTKKYNDLDLLSIDHYKEKYKYSERKKI